MKTYTQKELDIIIENHKHWLNKDCEGWENMKADLSSADLSCANLSNAILCGADLNYADLCSTNLSNADLRYADLFNVKLKNANLYSANLSCADLCSANLSNTDLSCANLSNAVLYGADLNCANLCSTNLSNADLRYADLRWASLAYANLKGASLICADLKNASLVCANLKHSILKSVDLFSADLVNAKYVPFIPISCPEAGSFIGYKKASNYIVELEILTDSRRCSATGRACRCDKARVLSIQNIDKNEPCNLKKVASDYNKNFIYKVGEIVEESNYNDDRWNECSPGIHFFINRQEAVEY